VGISIRMRTLSRCFSAWATAWARVLRLQGSGYVFTSDSYISHLRFALEKAGLHVKATIVWHKTNPGTNKVKTDFTSSNEYILFFTKGEGGHTFNWQGENEMQNFIQTSICGGNERLKNARNEVLHPTQKPEVLIRHFMSISSNRGDMVLDGFMGVGTTGKVAKTLGRKFMVLNKTRLSMMLLKGGWQMSNNSYSEDHQFGTEEYQSLIDISFYPSIAKPATFDEKWLRRFDGKKPS